MNYCEEIIYESPEVFLKSKDIVTIEKTMLVSIFERDDLTLAEIDIWDCAIQWGTGQNESLWKNISKWNQNDFKELKKILNDIIPLIRFKEISSDAFYEKIKPYKKIFDKDIFEELLKYHVTQPKLLFQKDLKTRTKKGKLLNFKLKSLISGWVDQNSKYYNIMIFHIILN